MKNSLVLVSAVATLAAVAAFSYAGRQGPEHPAPSPANAEGNRLLGRLPVAFVPNLGQWQHPARYVARVGAMTVFLEENGWTFTLVERTAEAGKDKTSDNAPARGAAVRMSFAGVGAGAAQLVAEDRLPGRHNYFLGNDPSKWRSDVPLYRSVRYRDVHPGVDVRAREHDGHFEYDLLLQPHADLDPVEIAVAGIERMHLVGDGALLLETAVGPVRMPAPLSWEAGPSGERQLITCRYVLRGENRFGFVVPERQPGWALVVDPGLLWSTFLGGTVQEYAYAIVLDAQGAATVAGLTESANYPTTPGTFDTSPNGYQDAVVTRLSPTGSSLVYSTFLGGNDTDSAWALALDPQGAATVAGGTRSLDFPTTPGSFDTSPNGSYDAFVTRLSPTGSSLVYSTFLGGQLADHAHALALDAQGAATVAGASESSDFPTTPGAFDTSHNGGYPLGDAFVTRVSSTGSSLVYSTFLGGTGIDWANALVLDTRGAATVTGSTSSSNFPSTPGSFDATHNGGDDAFVTQLSPTGSSLVYSTFLGGTGGDGAETLALDAQGVVTVAGSTDSFDFPTTSGAFDTTYGGGGDVFVTRLSSTGSSLVYSTFLGGGADDLSYSLALDTRGAATVVGRTESTDFPTTSGALDTTYNGSRDAFVTRLSPTGSSLVYSTFLGGTSDEYAVGLALDAQGAATVDGRTASTNFPTTPGAFDTSYNGGYDAFVTRLDMLPTGVAAFGRSSPGCTGPLAISVTSMPRVGNAGFALTCGNAPPQASGLLLFTVARFASPVIVLGTEVWIDPSLAYWPVSVGSNQTGASDVPLPIPNVQALRSMRLFAQFFWAGPTSPPPCPLHGLSASNALDITVQP